MGHPRRPDTVNLIIGLISGNDASFESARKRLRRLYGPTDLETPYVGFDHTPYYAKEMGGGLKRQFLSFRTLRHPAGLYRVKLVTNRIETLLSRPAEDGSGVRARHRTVNIDPGYLDLSKLVLFTTKDFTHRVYLDKGIFAEVTLYFKDGSYRPWPWTYPDYRTDEYISALNSIREIYSRKIRRLK